MSNITANQGYAFMGIIGFTFCVGAVVGMMSDGRFSRTIGLIFLLSAITFGSIVWLANTYPS
jgi:hypothetical protein